MFDLFGYSTLQIQMLLMRALLQALEQLGSRERPVPASVPRPAAEESPPASPGGTWVYPAPRDISSRRPSGFDALIEDASLRYRVDPALVKAVVQAESNFDAQAVSSAGARGLMQLMPATAASLGVQDAFNPAQNVDGGARLLRRLLDRYDQNVALALAAYNAGPGAVDKYGGVPPYAETQRYVPRVLGLYQAYRGED